MAKIVICRTDEVLGILSKRQVDAVLSFERPEMRVNEYGAAPRLQDRPQHIMICVGTEDQSHPQGPDANSIRLGLVFGSAVIRADQTLLIHCPTGRGRSPAMAIGILSSARPDATEAQIVEYVCKIRPNAAPNMLIVNMADNLTRRGGKLTQAVADHPVITRNRTPGRQIANLARDNPNAAMAALNRSGGPT